MSIALSPESVATELSGATVDGPVPGRAWLRYLLRNRQLLLGISILAPWVARSELKAGSLVSLPLGKRRLKRTWGILHRRGHRLGLAEETFLNLCREATQSLGATT